MEKHTKWNHTQSGPLVHSGNVAETPCTFLVFLSGDQVHHEEPRLLLFARLFRWRGCSGVYFWEQAMQLKTNKTSSIQMSTMLVCLH